MTEQTLPPPKHPGAGGVAAQEATPEAGPAQTVALEASSETTASDQTLRPNSPPPTFAPTSAPPDETHPRGVDPTFLAPQPSDQTLAPHMMATVEMQPGQAGSDQTIAGGPTTVGAGPDATMGGGMDAATRAFHQQAVASAPKAIAKGASFGHYELLEPIAKGGMGIVYKARQRNLNRIVAIKMILAGQFADQSDIDRFYAEAEAAAALSHPNIVAIHEIGEVSGQHFFSMDYIEGQSLAGLIQENPVPPRRAAEFVRTIAETMQFAHESGVVHRDLKPANILLDKRQRPLITDFGLAKQVSNTSQLTMAGSIVGTPSYMPPEQAAGKIEEVGPWSDLYSIGAILYELLTGRPPFRAASPFETIRQVLEQEPPSPRLLNPALPRDLETIALKCLQKERVRRYETVQELADELGRFLRGEPIQARPISQAARFWRLCKRYPLTSSAIALAIVILITASIVSTGFYIQASRALVQETAAKALAEQRKAQADASFRDAMDAVDQFLTRVGEGKLANLPGGQPIQKELLDDALVYNEKFLKQRGDDSSVANEVARSYFRVGKILMTLGRYDEALKPLSTAREKQVLLRAEEPDDPKRLKGLSDTLTELGQISVRKQDFEAASQDYAEASEIRGRLAKLFPDNDESQRLWANGHMNAGLSAFNIAIASTDKPDYFRKRMDEARDHYLKAQDIRQAWLAHDPKHWQIRRDLAKGFTNLGNSFDFDQQRVEAKENLEKAAALYEELSADKPGDLEIQRDLATARRRVADLFLSMKQPEEARQWYQEALRRLDTLVRENPDVPEYQAQKAQLLLNLKVLEQQQGNMAVAIAQLDRARRIYVPLVDKYKEVPTYRSDLLVILQELCTEQQYSGEIAAASETLNDTIALLDRFIGEFPDEQDYQIRLASAYCQRADLEGDDLRFVADESNADGLRQHLEKARATLEKLAGHEAATATCQYRLCDVFLRLSALEKEQGNQVAARQSLTQAGQLLDKIAAEQAQTADYQRQWFNYLLRLAQFETAEGNTTAAQTALQDAGTALGVLTKDVPDQPSYERVNFLLNRFDLEMKGANAQAARASLDEGRSILEKLLEVAPDEPFFRYLQTNLLLKEVELEKQNGNTTAAMDALEKARSVCTPLAETSKSSARNLVVILGELAKVQVAAGDASAAGNTLEEAATRIKTLAERYPKTVEFAQLLRDTQARLVALGPK